VTQIVPPGRWTGEALAVAMTSVTTTSAPPSDPARRNSFLMSAPFSGLMLALSTLRAEAR
jgi:hypothetical protein